jgi:hypothetical protein
MPPIRRRGPRGGLVSTRIPLNSINSVATNAANKRQPNEADQIDNALVSLERGFEKRAGFEVVPQNTIAGLTSWDTSSNNCRYDLYGLPTGADLFFYWYSINEDNTFLIAIISLSTLILFVDVIVLQGRSGNRKSLVKLLA